MKPQYRYLRQDFRDAARRRVAEARSLIPVKKRADGAATCALLAAECALKALLLHGHQLNFADEAPWPERPFKSKEGHNLILLWSLQHGRVSSLQRSEVMTAIASLSRLDRYAHRYGKAKPTQVQAQEAIDQADIIVRFMSEVVT